MKPMPTHMTTWRRPPATARRSAPRARRCRRRATSAFARPAGRSAHGEAREWVPWCETPLSGEASVKMADAEEDEGQEQAEPGVDPRPHGRSPST